MQSFIALLFISLSGLSEPRQTLFSTWTLELNKGRTVLERYQEYRMGGLEGIQSAFVIATPQGFLEMRELQRGGVLWRTKLEGPSQCEWTFDRGRIFGGDSKGNIYAVNATSGKILWKVSTKGVVYTKPLVHSGTLFVMNSLATVQAYDTETGAFQWQQSDASISTTTLWSRTAMQILDGQFIVGFPSALLQGMDPKDGRILWKESFADSQVASDAVNDLRALTASDPYLVASSFSGVLKVWSLKNSARKLMWVKNLSLHTSPTISGDTLYVSVKDGSIQSLELSNGYLKWKRELPKGIATQIQVDPEGRVWVASSGGQVFLYSSEGELLGSTPSVESPIWNPPVLAGPNEVIVLSAQAILRKFKYAKY